MVAIAAACLIANVAMAEQGTAEPKPVIPLIVMEGVPLSDAIKNLALQSEINYIIAPEVIPPFVTQPLVTARWENLTAMEALSKVLVQHRLALVENPETTVARVVRTNDTRKPGQHEWLSTGTNVAVPRILMEWVPLDQAVLTLVRQAGLNATLDPQLSKSLEKMGASEKPLVSIRWTNLSACQALAAVLDNYDLEFVPSKSGGEAQITARKWADAKAESTQAERSAEK